MLLSDDSPSMEYQPKNNPGNLDNKNNYKSGQRKLLVSEIQFLTKYGHLSDTVIYIGSAPGYHLNILIESFKNIKKWIFFDPYYTIINKTENIQINRQLFDKETANKYKSLNALLICDIRSYNKSIKQPIDLSDKTIIKDMQLQKEIVQNGNFIMCSLKFRLPWNLGTSTYYFDGELYTQSWTGEYSPELRLFTDGKTYKYYNHKKIDNQMYYYNKITRLLSFEILKKYEKNDYDQMNEYKIIYDYMKKILNNKDEIIEENIYNFITNKCEIFKAVYRN